MKKLAYLLTAIIIALMFYAAIGKEPKTKREGFDYILHPKYDTLWIKYDTVIHKSYYL